MLRRFSTAVLAVAAVVILYGIGASDRAQAQQRITIGTNPQGSLYYVVGGGIAKILSEELGRRATTQPYAGSSVYLPLVDSGEVTLGLISSLDGGRSYRGEGSEPTRNLRTIARLWPLSYAYVTRADSDIRTIQDLAGKRVVVEIRANAALAAANRAMLASGGLSEDDVESVDIGNLPQGIEGLIEDTLDATAIAVGIPLTRQAHASISGGIRYVALDGENATDAFLEEQLPGLFTTVVEPSDARPGVQEPTKVTGFDVFLIGSAEISDEEAAELARTVHEHFDTLREDYPPLRSAQADEVAAATNTVPYHPGAIAYFKEQGLWSEANEEREARLD